MNFIPVKVSTLDTHRLLVCLKKFMDAKQKRPKSVTTEHRLDSHNLIFTLRITVLFIISEIDRGRD
jgi:hypothetical protein